MQPSSTLENEMLFNGLQTSGLKYHIILQKQKQHYYTIWFILMQYVLGYLLLVLLIKPIVVWILIWIELRVNSFNIAWKFDGKWNKRKKISQDCDIVAIAFYPIVFTVCPFFVLFVLFCPICPIYLHVHSLLCPIFPIFPWLYFETFLKTFFWHFLF